MHQYNALVVRWKAEQDRLDRRTAEVVCCLTNIHRDRKKFPQPIPLSEFLPQKAIEESRPMTAEQIRQKVFSIHAALTGEDVTKRC